MSPQQVAYFNADIEEIIAFDEKIWSHHWPECHGSDDCATCQKFLRALATFTYIKKRAQQVIAGKSTPTFES